MMRTTSGVVGGAWLLLACTALAEPTSDGPVVVEPEGKPGTKLVFWLGPMVVRDSVTESLFK